MKRFVVLVVALLSIGWAGAVGAAATKTYQVTGPVLELRDDAIVVQKGKEKWEIARGPDTKVSGGELKVGSKVTIEYRMTATTVEVKGGEKGAAGAKDEGKGTKPAK
jgi:hypothetical protein